MEEENESGATVNEQKILKEAPELVKVLKEMKTNMDFVTTEVQKLTEKVKANDFPTVGGLSFLEAKHLLLVSYCQLIVYYVSRKAKGLSVEGHPVVRSLAEIRLFLEKIRPIDKKCAYQIERLLNSATTEATKVDAVEKEVEATQNSEDLLKYRPNPNMLVSKGDMTADDQDGVYRPPKIAPTTMAEGKKTKEEKKELRKQMAISLQAKNSEFVRNMVNDMEGRPEEVREFGGLGAESKQKEKYVRMWEKREELEEELFNRAPLKKGEKRELKRLKNNDGLYGMADDFYDEIKGLPFGDDAEKHKGGFGARSSVERKHKKRKKY